MRYNQSAAMAHSGVLQFEMSAQGLIDLLSISMQCRSMDTIHLQGKRHGHGSYYYANDEVYTGDFDNDERHGLGRMQYRNGDVYEGCWERGHRCGPGRLTNSDSDVIFEGLFVNGCREGLGTLLCISRV
jgi:hypothetical protein